MAVAFEQGSWVWITDEEERFLPAKVLTPFHKGEATRVQTEDGEERALSAAESALATECNEEALSSKIEDLVSISDLNEMSILHCLRIRFKQDRIYTNISSILISVNPFKLLPLYTPEVLEDYRQGYRGKSPHVFGIAYNAFHDMLNENRDQSVVISGESGAGKSEATKLILQFLTDVSHRTVPGGGGASTSQSLEQQILAANPILEALGNAKTLRNNNSSRFGKLITVNFDKNGQIIGGNIINYLLEKSRVVQQTQGERNYHIFYQLLSAATTNPTLTTELDLKDAELFAFTGQSGVIHVDGISDEKDFEDIQNSLNILQFSAEEKSMIFRIVAGVLHFGNVKFKVEQRANQEDSCSIQNVEVLTHASSMWGVDGKQIEKFLTSRHIGTREIILVSYNITQALDARDAMVKRVYAELFQYVVDRINVVLSAGGLKRNKFIGVLDIFGFESFAVNSFEQLCINFCNEKLQFHFNEHIFKMEQALYAQEGIVIPGSSFVDNQPTLDLLEAKATGVFSMIDEEISVPKGSDEGVLSKILQKHADGKHPNMIRPKAKDVQDFLKNFGILHYAGPVFYNISNFLEKNKDQLHPDIVTVLRESSSFVMKKMFPPEVASKVPAAAGAAKKLTLGSQFKNQLNDLINTLNATFPHFVRCMKSNDKKAGNVFTSSRMQDQLRYAGLVEVCRIRKLGFPVRRPFDEFYKRYKCCDLLSPNLDSLLLSLKKLGILKDGEWAKGKSRVFYRTLQASQLELAREASLVKVTVVIQKYARRFIFRRRFSYMLKVIQSIKAAIEKREEKELADCIDMSHELPFGGGHLKIVKDAKVLLLRIQEEKRVIKILENAMLSNDINSLKSAINAANAVVPAFFTPLVQQAYDLIAKLEREAEAREALKQAISKRDLEQLTIWIAKAQEMGMTTSELPQAIALKARIDQENQLLAHLRDATERKHLEDLNKYISQCIELGLDRPEIKAGKAVVDRIYAEQAERAAEAERQRKADEAAAAKRKAILEEAKRKLDEAKKTNNAAMISAALESAMQLGLQSEEVNDAQKHLAQAQKNEETKSQLMAAVQVLQVKSEVGMVDGDLEVLNRAISNAETVAGADEISELKFARDALMSFQRQIQIRSDLLNAIATKDRKILVAAIDAAENLDLSSPELKQAKDMIRDMEAQRRRQSAVMTEEPNLEPYDAAEEARKKRQDIAKQAKYDIKYYPGLRTPDDFARGAILNKSKIKEGFLVFQNYVIPKSLLDLNSKEANKLALQMHKDLLGYMGDKQMPFPAMLAQDILRKGYEYKPIRDEIYLQIIKQLAGNPRAESVAKGWQMLCMCVGTFPPSYEFENYLLHYILEKRDRGRGAVVDYARYCLRTLEAILSNGDGSGFVPSVEEILAYKDRPPILATIYLVDGNVITEDLPITPDLNVGKVLEMCTGWLDLRDPRVNTLGMFVYDMGEIEDPKGGDNPFANAPYKDLIRTPRPLRNEDFMGDVIVQKARQRRKFKFILKKKIFLPQHRQRGDDPFYERLVYLQAEDEAIIQGNISISDVGNVMELAAISMAVAFGDTMGNAVEELVDAGVIDFIVPSWRDVKTPEQWGGMILPRRSEFVERDPEDLQQRFLEIVHQSPYYGTHWFYVHKIEPPPNQVIPQAIRRLPRDLILAYNSEGLHIFDTQRHLLTGYSFADIYRWGGSSSQFSLILADESVPDSFEFCVITSQAADMAAIILDHVRAIMAEEGSAA